MYVAGQNQQALNLIASLGANWNIFLMSGAVPASLETMPFQLVNIDSVFDNAIQGLRAKAVNSAGYGQEMIAFEYQGNLFTLKEHGARALNGVTGIQCIPQSIRTNVLGLDKPKGYVNGLDDNTQLAYGTDLLLDTKYIEYDFGTPCSINSMSFGNSSTAARNPTSITVQYYNSVTSQWTDAAAITSIKTYIAAGVVVNFSPVVAQRWRVVFTGNPTAQFEYRWLRFIASVIPENIMSKSGVEVTWAILVPALPTESIYESARSTQIPAICLEAGGPLDQKPIVLNRKSAGVDDIVSLVHCKIFPSVSKEIEVIV